jgi:SAM-dependent methyltransferase
MLLTRPATPGPSAWVQRFTSLLRPGASVLDLACGSGRHVRWLVRHGFAVTGVDRDAAALSSLAPLAGPAELVVADLEAGTWPFPDRQFDGIVVTNYLWRPLFPQLLAALADGGALLYETFADGQQSIGKPSRPDFLLKPGELLQLCRGLRAVAFEDGFEALPAPGRFVQRIAAVRQAAAAASAPRHLLHPGAGGPAGGAGAGG